MAYMPLDKSRMYLDRSKNDDYLRPLSSRGVSIRRYGLFQAPGKDLQFPRGQYLLGRFHKRTMTYTGTLHAGTHMDAPNHVLHEEEVDRERNGYSLDELPLEYCIGSGVILDMRHLRDEFEATWKTGFEADLWRIIMPEDVDKACEKDGLEIRENDWVVINTGFHNYWRINNDKYYNYYPGMGPEIAEYLIHEEKDKRNFRNLGCDRFSHSGIIRLRSRCHGSTRPIAKQPIRIPMLNFLTMNLAIACTCRQASSP